MSHDPRVVAEIHAVLISQFRLKEAQLTPETHVFADLGFDSLDAIDLITLVEDRLGINIEVEQFATVRTLGDVYALVASLKSTGEAEPQAEPQPKPQARPLAHA